MPSVFATLYSLFCVPFNISLCCPRSPKTACPLAKYSSRALCVLAKKFCSLNAWASLCWSPLPNVLEFAFSFGFQGELAADVLAIEAFEYGFSGVAVWWGRRPRSSPRSATNWTSSEADFKEANWARYSWSSERKERRRSWAFSFFEGLSSDFWRVE